MTTRRPARASDRGEQGFTVIELLIALSVSLIGLAGLLSLSTAITAGTRSSIRATEATALAESVLEELRREPMTDIVTAFGPVPIAVQLPNVAGRNDLLFGRKLSVEQLPTEQDLIRMRVEVTWNDTPAAPLGDGSDDHRILLEVLRDEGAVQE